MADFKWNTNYTDVRTYLSENAAPFFTMGPTTSVNNSNIERSRKICNHIDPYAKLASIRSTIWPSIDNGARGRSAQLYIDALDDIDYMLESEQRVRLHPVIDNNRKFI